MYANDNIMLVEQPFSLAIASSGMSLQERRFSAARSAEGAYLSTPIWRPLPIPGSGQTASAPAVVDIDNDPRWPFVLGAATIADRPEQPPLQSISMQYLSESFPGAMAVARNIPAFIVLTVCAIELMRLVG